MPTMSHKAIREYQKKVEQHCSGMGLTTDQVNFMYADPQDISIIAAYGFMERHGHWSFGADYLRFLEMQKNDMLRIRELVINTSPVQAYLNSQNSVVANKLVICHVYGHVDFNMNNIYFLETDPELIVDSVRKNSAHIGELEAEHSPDTIELVLDACLTVAPYVDEYERLIKPSPTNLINFLRNNAPLLPYERELLEITAQEALHLKPISKAKMMNEGWAAYIQEQLLYNEDLLANDEIDEFTTMHAMMLNPHSSVAFPYSVGYAIWDDIVERYGFEKALLIRSTFEDTSFIDQYFNQAVCDKVIFQYETKELELQDGKKRKIKERVDVDAQKYKVDLMSQIVNVQPRIIAQKEGKDLVLWHSYDGKTLDEQSIRPFLEQVCKLWKDRVVFATYNEKHENINYICAPNGPYYKRLTPEERGMKDITELIL